MVQSEVYHSKVCYSTCTTIVGGVEDDGGVFLWKSLKSALVLTHRISYAVSRTKTQIGLGCKT